jgi:hypothetical protein
VNLESRSAGTLRRSSREGTDRKDRTRALSAQSEPALCPRDEDGTTPDVFPCLPVFMPCSASGLGGLAFHGRR